MSNSDDLDHGATMRSFSAGQKLFNDRYTLKKFLGAGGMGVVWLAQDEQLNQEVALKFLHEMLMSDRAALDDLKKEVRRSREMSHPHIVRIHDFVAEAQRAAISMEYVSGDTVSNRRADRDQKIFSVAELSPWCEQICSALQYAHTKAKVVHRDLKPVNLMLDSSDEIKIADFGIARSIADSVSRASAVGNTSGTPVYMSPQQHMGEKSSPSDDIYAFGATIYELLTSRPPFHSGNVLLQVQNKVPPSMAERRIELEVTGDPIPEQWERTIAACLAKEPAGRPASMQAVAEGLGLGGAAFSTATGKGGASPAVDTTKPVAAKPAAPSVPRKPLPRWVVPAASAAAVVMVAAIFGPGLWNSRQASQASQRAQEALIAKDWPTALAAAREAATRRPQDEAFRTAYDDVQRDWLKSLRAAGAGSGEEIFQALAGLPADISASLAESHAADFARLRSGAQDSYRQKLQAATAEAQDLAVAGKFAEADAKLARWRAFAVLAPADLAASETTVKSVKMRGEIRAALELATGGDATAALAKLDMLAKQGVGGDEIAAARRKVQTMAEATAAEQLARALVANDAGAVQAALAGYGKISGKPAKLTAAELLSEKDFEKFQLLLGQLGMRPAAGAAATGRLDLVVIEALRERFSPAAAAATFLAKSYSEWAREELGRQRFGSALLLLGHAKKAEDSPALAALEREITEGLVRRLDLHLALPLTETAAGAPGALQTAGRNALGAYLRPIAGSAMNFVASADSKRPNTVVVRTQLLPFQRADETKLEKKSVNYQSGIKQVPNPAKAEAQKAYDQARENEKGTKVVAGIAGALFGGFLGGGSSNSGASSDQKLQNTAAGAAAGASGLSALVGGAAGKSTADIKKILDDTPATIASPVIVQVPYDEVTHNLTYATGLNVELLSGGRPFGKPLTVKTSFKHDVVEVKGDASKGVPVKELTEPSGETLGAALALSLSRELEQSGPGLIRAIADASLVAVEAQFSTSQSVDRATDLRWGLIQLWGKAGLSLPDPLNSERALRFELGLPTGK